MDLVILIVLIAIVIIFFKRFSSFIYFLAITDIFLRIMTFINVELARLGIYLYLNKYIPASIPSIINSYSSGILNTVLMWLYVIAIIIFESYIIKTFFRKK